jgi:hypothetical protein
MKNNLLLHARRLKKSKLSLSYMARRSAPNEADDRPLQALAASLRQGE